MFVNCFLFVCLLSRQHEISQLSEEWRRLAAKLETTSAVKSQIQIQYDESYVTIRNSRGHFIIIF